MNHIGELNKQPLHAALPPRAKFKGVLEDIQFEKD